MLLVAYHSAAAQKSEIGPPELYLIQNTHLLESIQHSSSVASHTERMTAFIPIWGECEVVISDKPSEDVFILVVKPIFIYGPGKWPLWETDWWRLSISTEYGEKAISAKICFAIQSVELVLHLLLRLGLEHQPENDEQVSSPGNRRTCQQVWNSQKNKVLPGDSSSGTGVGGSCLLVVVVRCSGFATIFFKWTDSPPLGRVTREYALHMLRPTLILRRKYFMK